MYVLRKYTQNLLPRQVKRTKVVFFICSFIIQFNSYALENNGRGVKAVAMANAFVAISDNCWAIDYNPAGLTQVNIFQCSAFIVPEQFGLKELRTVAVAAVVPLSFAVSGFKLEKFGFDLYNETEIGITLAGKIDRAVSFGFSLNYNRLNIMKYGTNTNLTVNAGILARVIERVSIGFSARNITGKTIGRDFEKMPQSCMLGTSWSPIKDLLISIEIEKDIRFPAMIKAGAERIFYDVLAFRVGVANNPDKYSAGIAVRYSLFEFGYAGYSHSDLGWTHQIEITFELDHKEKCVI